MKLKHATITSIFRENTDEERLIVKDRALSRMHEFSHYRQFSQADRIITSARQARNNDHLEFDENKS
jgi:hypothetical protein